jgi:hypothetical protein
MTIQPSEWKFKTKRYEIYYWSTSWLAVAEVHSRPRKEWPIAVAADLGCRKSRKELVTEAVERMITKRLRNLHQ